MKLLVDTHIFLWIVLSSKKIRQKTKDILLDPENIKTVSSITFWEISLKYQLGKLDLNGILPSQLPAIAKETGFEILSLDADIASTFYQLPGLKNKDPFDRMLAWQAICQNCYLVSKDSSLADYKSFGLKVLH